MRRAPWGAAIAAAVVLLGACGGGGTKHDGAQGVAATAVAATLPAEAPSTLPAEEVTTVAPTTAAPTTLPPTTEAPTTTAAIAPSTTAAPIVLPQPQPIPPEGTEKTTEVGRISIPKLGLDLEMFEGVTLGTLDHGPGHWPGTAMPGQRGNVVVAGHRVSHSKPFRYLDKLVAGDQVTFEVGGATSTYEVTGHDIVTPTTVQIVDQTADYTATLFACHPPGSTAYRYVVHLRLVSAPAN
jgi:sortase A